MTSEIAAAAERVGEPFQRLIKHGDRNPYKKWYAKYLCGCGAEFVSPVANVESGKTKSCGCLARMAVAALNRTHGKSASRVYEIWSGMIKRCTDPSYIKYLNYGGRGISVCERWLKFENFYADMGDPPQDMSIDRIETNGNYCPENCRWATRTEQARNTRANRFLVIRGERKTMAEWAERSDTTYKNIHLRLRRGWSEEDAVFGRKGDANVQV